MTGRADQQSRQRSVLVVGVGNADRGDDAVGPIVARELAGRLPGDVTIVARGGDMLSLVEDWAGHAAVVIIDAAAPMGLPGAIHRIDLRTDELPRDISMTSSHSFGVSEALDLARALGGAPECFVVYAVEGLSFDHGAPVTSEVMAAVDEATELVVSEVARLRRDAAGAPGRGGVRHEATIIEGQPFGRHNG
jgi:hydrogenase maturation protease